MILTHSYHSSGTLFHKHLSIHKQLLQFCAHLGIGLQKDTRSDQNRYSMVMAHPYAYHMHL